MLDELYTPGVPSIEFFENSILHGTSHILVAFGPAISYNSPLWFLTCLFVTELFFYGLAKRYYGRPKKLVFWLTVFGVIGYLYSVYVPFRIPWNVDVALAAIVFYGAGNLFRRFVETKKELGITENFSRIENYVFVPFILLNLLYLGYLLKFPTEDKVNMNVLQYGSFFSFYLLAFSGIFTYVYLFKKIGSSKVLEYYGKNSLIILALHFPLKDVLTKVLALSLGVNTEYFYYNLGFALSLTIMNLVLLIPVIYVVNNYFPFLLGKKGSSKNFEDIKVHFRKPAN
jgi:fucose 4-O-acetylase-like acetyltransferase